MNPIFSFYFFFSLYKSKFLQISFIFQFTEELDILFFNGIHFELC